MPPKTSKLLCVGQIGAPHGVKGEVKIKSFTEDPSSIFAYAPLTDESGKIVFRLKQKKGAGEQLVASVAGVTTRTEAEKLKNIKLYCQRSKLPVPGKNRFYADDLKDLRAVDDNGAEVGRVTGFYNFGAGDILAVENKVGREWMLPFRSPFVETPDLDEGCVRVNIPEGYPFSEKVGKNKRSKG